MRAIPKKAIIDIVNEYSDTAESVVLTHRTYSGIFKKSSESAYVVKTENNNFLVAQTNKESEIKNLFFVSTKKDKEIVEDDISKVYIVTTLCNMFPDMNPDK